MENQPWWRRPKVTWWDRAIGIALALVIGLIVAPAWLGTSWRDQWIAAGCWFLIILVVIQVRSRLIRRNGEA